MRASLIAGVMLTSLMGPAVSQEWRTLVEPQFGTRVEIPSEVFSVHEGPSARGIGEEYTTGDGRAALAVYSQRNLHP